MTASLTQKLVGVLVAAVAAAAIVAPIVAGIAAVVRNETLLTERVEANRALAARLASEETRLNADETLFARASAGLGYSEIAARAASTCAILGSAFDGLDIEQPCAPSEAITPNGLTEHRVIMTVSGAPDRILDRLREAALAPSTLASLQLAAKTSDQAPGALVLSLEFSELSEAPIDEGARP